MQTLSEALRSTSKSAEEKNSEVLQAKFKLYSFCLKKAGQLPSPEVSKTVLQIGQGIDQAMTGLVEITKKHVDSTNMQKQLQGVQEESRL